VTETRERGRTAARSFEASDTSSTGSDVASSLATGRLMRLSGPRGRKAIEEKGRARPQEES
jgi:hypothetical protein